LVLHVKYLLPHCEEQQVVPLQHWRVLQGDGDGVALQVAAGRRLGLACRLGLAQGLEGEGVVERVAGRGDGERLGMGRGVQLGLGCGPQPQRASLAGTSMPRPSSPTMHFTFSGASRTDPNTAPALQ
jgi:hypothetical protein